MEDPYPTGKYPDSKVWVWVPFSSLIWVYFPGKIDQKANSARMRLSYLQLRSCCLRFVFFTCGGGTVSREEQTQFLDGGNRKQKIGGRKTAQEKKTNSWERRFPGTFRTNVPLILPIFSVFSVGGGPKVPRNFVPGNFFLLF